MFGAVFEGQDEAVGVEGGRAGRPAAAAGRRHGGRRHVDDVAGGGGRFPGREAPGRRAAAAAPHRGERLLLPVVVPVEAVMPVLTLRHVGTDDAARYHVRDGTFITRAPATQ